MRLRRLIRGNQMKQMLLILNPTAGQRRANRYLPDIIGLFNRAGYQVSVHVTSRSGEATQVAAQLAGHTDLVVCCGGDGTFNEVVNGLLQKGLHTPIGYIPAGSTNDFAASLKLPTNIMAAARRVMEGTPRKLDVGSFDGRYFSYVASFGAFTRASYATPQNIKNALGHTAYILEGIQELSQLRKIHARLRLDGVPYEDDFLFGAISNSTSVAGILTLDPKQVDMCDGKFEVLLVRSPRDLLEIHECIQALQTQKYNCSAITFQTAAHVRIESCQELTWTLDGERADFDGQVDIHNHHEAITIIQ